MSFVIIAHRGWRCKCPENTIAAFSAAIDNGFPHFETDVQLTKDGTCVIFHDENLERTTNSTGPLADVRMLLTCLWENAWAHVLSILIPNALCWTFLWPEYYTRRKHSQMSRIWMLEVGFRSNSLVWTASVALNRAIILATYIRAICEEAVLATLIIAADSYAGERIPTLEQVMQQFASQAHIHLVRCITSKTLTSVLLIEYTVFTGHNIYSARYN